MVDKKQKKIADANKFYDAYTELITTIGLAMPKIPFSNSLPDYYAFRICGGKDSLSDSFLGLILGDRCHLAEKIADIKKLLFIAGILCATENPKIQKAFSDIQELINEHRDKEIKEIEMGSDD